VVLMFAIENSKCGKCRKLWIGIWHTDGRLSTYRDDDRCTVMIDDLWQAAVPTLLMRLY